MNGLPQMSRLNSQGEDMGKPTQNPTSRIGVNNQRQVGVLYGHNGGGKVYNYLGGAGLRVGDTVTPGVTHPKSGKDYKTLARVVMTRDSKGLPACDTSGNLSGKGIMMKTIGQTDQQSLPGFKVQQQANASFTAKQWKQEANETYKLSQAKRLNSTGEVSKRG